MSGYDPIGATRDALEPVIDWYQSDEHPQRSLPEIVTDVVADLQKDRQDCLRMERAIRNGNAENDVPDLLEFLAEKLVVEHGEKSTFHYITSAYALAKNLRAALPKPEHR